MTSQVKNVYRTDLILRKPVFDQLNIMASQLKPFYRCGFDTYNQGYIIYKPTLDKQLFILPTTDFLVFCSPYQVVGMQKYPKAYISQT